MLLRIDGKTEDERGSHMCHHVRFPQELHPKKGTLVYLFEVFVESEAMLSIYRGSLVMANTGS